MEYPIKHICGIVHRRIPCTVCRQNYWVGPSSFKASAKTGYVCLDCSDSMSMKDILVHTGKLIDHIIETRSDIVEQAERETGHKLERKP